jgi:spore coat protein CotH
MRTPLIGLGVLCASVASADEAEMFFDDTVVQEIRITFDDPNWYDTLYNAHQSDPDDPFFEAHFQWGDIILDTIGIRFKGNSSFSIPSVKKSIKIDFDEYDEGNADLEFLGMSAMALNNGFKDPSMLREKLFLDAAATWLPTIRSVHTRVYINEEYWGLYTAIEQVNKDFVQSRFGNGEDGNLFKGQASDDASGPGSDFGSDMTWLGWDPEPYHDKYQLKTNEAEDDYSQLIEFIDALNNSTVENRPDQLGAVLDIDSSIRSLALNMLYTNLDSYNGSAHNYYLYDRDDTGQFTHLMWDTNEAYGNFRMGMTPDQAIEMSPYWLPSGSNSDRPFMSNIWEVDEWNRDYLRVLARMLRETFTADGQWSRIQELADLIRDDVYADTNAHYSNAQFEQNLTDDVGGGGGGAVGLKRFVDGRIDYLQDYLQGFASRSDLIINEIMPVNAATLADDAGEFDPWVEIYNRGPGTVTIQNVALTDDPAILGKWVLPNVTLADGEHLLLWLDGDTDQGNDHASFLIDGTGGTLTLSKRSGSWAAIDTIDIPVVPADASMGRQHDDEGPWGPTVATPGSANVPDGTTLIGVLFVNEFMADNETTIQDPDDDGNSYEDWIELYNASESDVDLSGLYMTDDPTQLTKWEIPSGVAIEAGEYLIIWADEDADEGETHADFKLSDSGEEVVLVAADGVTIIDSIAFGGQMTDISQGRSPDGSVTWRLFTTPTPGATNEAGIGTAGPLYINEFMANNDSAVEDPDMPGEYDDWIEIYNDSDEVVDLAGYFLTDDLANPDKWAFVEGISIAAGGFILVIADEQSQGDLHAGFRLSGDGEAIGLFAPDGLTLLDGVTFGMQEMDVSQGRSPDGGDAWEVFDPSTPGSPNESVPGDLDGDGTVGVSDLLIVLDAWGVCGDPSDCPADLDGDGTVGVSDLLIILGEWG